MRGVTGKHWESTEVRNYGVPNGITGHVVKFAVDSVPEQICADLCRSALLPQSSSGSDEVAAYSRRAARARGEMGVSPHFAQDLGFFLDF